MLILRLVFPYEYVATVPQLNYSRESRPSLTAPMRHAERRWREDRPVALLWSRAMVINFRLSICTCNIPVLKRVLPLDIFFLSGRPLGNDVCFHAAALLFRNGGIGF